MRRAALLLALLSLGCQDVNLKFVVELPQGFTREELSLKATIFMPVADFATCDDLAYGDISAEALRASQVAVVDLDDETSPVEPLPLGGYKLVLVEGIGMARDPLGGSSEAVVVAGCAQIEGKPKRPGPFNADREIKITLEQAVWLQVRTEAEDPSAPVNYSVSIPWESELDLDEIQVVITDANLRVPTDGTVIRAQVIYGAGMQTDVGEVEPGVQIDETLVASAGGFGYFTPRVHFAGPFEVVIAARWALGPSQQYVAGFAIPENAEGDAFPGRNVIFARPARLGDGSAGFVATTSAGGRLYHSTALFSHFDASGQPIFNTTDVEASAFNAADWVSDCGTARRTPDGEAVTLLQPVRANPLQELWWVDASSGVQRAVMLPQPGSGDPRPEWASVVPVGPCQGGAGNEVLTDNGPIAVNLTVVPDASMGGYRNRLIFTNLIVGTESNAGNGNTSAPVDLTVLTQQTGDVPVALSSHCVTDEEGTVHRLLVFGIIRDELVQRFVMVDMGVGVANAGTVDIGILRDGRRFDDVSWLHYFDSTQGSGGQPLLLGLSYQGFSYDVEVLRVSSAGVILRPQQTLATGLPPSVELLASGDLIAPGSRDVVNVFPTRGSATGSFGQAVITVISNSWELDEPLLFSGYRIEENLNLEESSLMVADSDGDDVDEIFLLLRVSDGTENLETVPTVIRLGAW